MDFANRNSQTPVQRPTGSDASGTSSSSSSSANAKKAKKVSLLKAGLVGLLFCGTILVVALVLLFSVRDNSASKYVDNGKLQAVFLNNGQVYFGNIKALNDKYIDLTNIYYLRTDSGTTASTTTSSNNISLVKLGCELHGPADEMLINVEQLTFWENLKTDGQVAKAIATYKQQNPNGQNCNTQSSSTTDQTTPNATTPSNNSGTTTTNGTTKTNP